MFKNNKIKIAQALFSSLIMFQANLAIGQGSAPGLVEPEGLPDFRLALPSKEGQKIIILKGSIRGKNLTIEKSKVATGFLPNIYISKRNDFKIELTNKQGKVIDSVPMNDPRVVHDLEEGGEMFIRNDAEFQVAIPYKKGSTGLRVKPGIQRFIPPKQSLRRGIRPDSLSLPNQVMSKLNLKPAFKSFCLDKPDDDDCNFVLKGKKLDQIPKGLSE